MLWINQWGANDNKTSTFKLLLNVWPTVATFDPCRGPWKRDVYPFRGYDVYSALNSNELFERGGYEESAASDWGQRKEMRIMIIPLTCQSWKAQVLQTDVNLWVGLSGQNRAPPSSPTRPCPIISPREKKKLHVACRLPVDTLTIADSRVEDWGQMKVARGKRSD